MPLQIRRGTDAERLGSFTPAEGELIYTTDTKKLYVGDGATAGGVAIDTVGGGGSGASTLNDLTDVNVGGAANGNILAYDTSATAWALAPNIIDQVNTLLTTSLAEAGEILSWNGSTYEWIADATGGGGGGMSVLTDDTAPALGGNLDLNSYDITGTGNIDINGNVTATNFVGTLTGDIIGDLAGTLTGDVLADDDTTVLVNSTTRTFNGDVTGNLVGNVDGDLLGSVFADDSSLIINGLDGGIHASIIHAKSNNLDIVGDTDVNPLDLNITSSASEPGRVNFSRKDLTADLSLDTISNGRVTFSRNDINGAVTTSFINGRNDCLFLFANTTGNAADVASYVTLKDQKLGIGTVAPAEELDVQGNAVVTGFVQFGSLTTAERDALTAADGMVIYNTTDNKFQGRENGVWVNLV